MRNQDFDAIVVGSGISGGWAAKELTEKGLKVLLIERGRSITPEDYVGEHKGAWEMPFRGFGDRQRYEREYPIQKTASQFSEYNEQFFPKDSEHPYVQDPANPFTWIRGYQLGGKSLTWGRVTPRLGPVNFTENAKDGHGVDWPIRYEDIRPWYDHVEEFIGVSGQTEIDFPSTPVGRYLPPFEMNCMEQHTAAEIARRYDDRRLIMAPVAILTQDHKGRAACHYCGPCERGCSTGSYFSSISSTLPAAQATGNLTIVTNAVVEGLDYDPGTRRISGVRVIDSKSRARSVHRGKIVFLNASTLGTTQILLNSRSETWPEGLGNKSGVLGRYLMDHCRAGAFGVFATELDKYQRGNRPASCYMPRFRNMDASSMPFVRGYGYQAFAMRMGWDRGFNTPGYGAALKKGLRQPGMWMMFMAGFGECLPDRNNHVSLDPVKKDDWGIPILNTRFQWGENERKMGADMQGEAKAMLKTAGAVFVQAFGDQLAPGGTCIHEMGTARMGRDPATSYLNGFNQSHEVANLFVTDGAAMASSGCQNPSLTYMALTARAANHAVERMKLNQL